jgi:hypothetical protein
MRRQFIPARLKDNPSLDAEEYKGKLAGLDDPALVKAMLDGDWNIVAGGAVDDVWRTAIHIIPAFEFPKTWRVDRSFDWGSSKPFSVGWWAESDGSQVDVPTVGLRTFPKGTLFRIAELYGWNGNPNEGCKMLAVEVARQIKEAEKTASLLKGRKIYPARLIPAYSMWRMASQLLMTWPSLACAGQKPIRTQVQGFMPGSTAQAVKGWHRTPHGRPGTFHFLTPAVILYAQFQPCRGI